MSYDLLIRNGTLVTAEEGELQADLAIADGRVAARLPRGAQVSSAREIHVDGQYVLPGLVDSHVHIDLGPGEDRYRESKSAALGGITTFIHYGLSSQPYEDQFVAEVEKGERESVVDFAFHYTIVTAEQLQSLPLYVREFGVGSFKHFMHFKGNEGAYMGLTGTDDGHLYELCESVARLPGTVLVVHPENIEVAWKLAERLKTQGRTDLAAYTEARPALVECDNLYTVMLFARTTGATAYIPHLSCVEGLEEYKRQRPLYPHVYLETCPHYLTHSMYDPIGSLGKVNPPLRTPRDNAALWDAVLDGTIDVVATDHVPRRREKKQGGVWKASAGFPGMGTLLRVMLSEGVHRRGLSLQRLVALTSTKPAKVFGLYPRKGAMQPGSDADLVVVDLAREETIDPTRLGSFADYSLYEGWTLKGTPTLTLVRGTVVMQDGEIVVPEGYGRYVRAGSR